ncbi:MAG: hypothetical protein M3178_00875 [Pseudomonadota bacterium]|nr:hypothetical protein [Pseudomonadota bacterium]
MPRSDAPSQSPNRLTENSAWNDQLLAEQLKELSILDLDFDLEATGFDMGEIDLRIESLDEKGGLVLSAHLLGASQRRLRSRPPGIPNFCTDEKATSTYRHFCVELLITKIDMRIRDVRCMAP